MILLINHLTRMRGDAVCLAGIEENTGKHVRPVLFGALLITRDMLLENGGQLALGHRIDFGNCFHVPSAPEVEDHEFSHRNLKNLGRENASRFYQIQRVLASDSLQAIFGDQLRKIGHASCGVDQNCGIASLGCFRPATTPKLYMKQRFDRPAQVRMNITDGEFELDLGVTDIRLYDARTAAPKISTCRHVANEMRRGVRVTLAVGLSRAFSPTQGETPVHWLQVNNIFLETDPYLLRAI